MARNLSVEQFKELIKRIPKSVADQMRAGVFEQAEVLANVQRSAVAVDTGNLRASIRVEQGQHPLQALVKAGGPLTTKEVRAGSGQPYDYSLGTEYGTEKESAQPFFWPSYRLTKKRIRAGIQRKALDGVRKVVNLG